MDPDLALFTTHYRRLCNGVIRLDYMYGVCIRALVFLTQLYHVMFPEKSLEFDEMEGVKVVAAPASGDGDDDEETSRPTRRRRRDGM